MEIWRITAVAETRQPYSYRTDPAVQPFARNRFRIAGRRVVCYAPPAEFRDRFVE
ncbi:MAG TPA: hypothetical protein VMY41_12145 [Thermohalobaculum sp.]|nr:hypothetical protein [Thermohalobaculum sp.]